MYTEDELLPISALQHLIFCERQCALVHIERVWKDNPLTLEGSALHRRVDEEAPRRERRGDSLVLRSVPLRSHGLGLVGRADVVEFHRCPPSERLSEDGGFATAILMGGLDGVWRPFPVEYKRGRPHPERCDEVQLCAQALSLEEMLEVRIPAGALFYGRAQRRLAVRFDEDLRQLTRDAASRLRHIIESGMTPPAIRMPKCANCSLADVCLPDSMSDGRSAETYIRQMIGHVRRGSTPR